MISSGKLPDMLDPSKPILRPESTLSFGFQAPCARRVSRLCNALQMTVAAAGATLAGPHCVKGADMLANSVDPMGLEWRVSVRLRWNEWFV